MTPAADGLEAEIDRLYGLALDQFTPARDQLARTLRQEGDREAAAEVKRLRKPNLPAWALNQVQRLDPERVGELLRAGARLQEAQQRLVTGGERGLLRSATADERRLVEELVALAERQLAGAGHSPTAMLQSKLWATVHAAAVTTEVGELLEAGRLLRDREISDLGLIAGGPGEAPAAEPAGKARAKGQARNGGGGAAGRKAGTAAGGAAEREAAAAREAVARRAVERREAKRQAAARAAAERKAQGLRRQLDRARAQVAELERALRELEK
jgi:hypothetical protein